MSETIPPSNETVPVFDETIGGALIDAARINVMAALTAFPTVGPEILLPGDEDHPTINECLVQAAQWLDAARAISVQMTPEAMTSIHVVEGKG
jgi:hypothetical protein